MKHSLCLLVAASLVTALLPTEAQVVNTLVDLGTNTSAYDVIVDPFNPATKLFLAGHDSSAGATIFHVDLTQVPVGISVVDRAPGDIAQLGYDSNMGVLFSVGSVYDASAGGRSWQVRRSVDQGATWSGAGPNYQYKAGAAAYALDLTCDNLGTVYTCGYAYNRDGGSPLWIVRKSQNSGATWTTCAAIGKGGNDAAMAAHFVADYGTANHGGIFVAGRLGSTWTVQRSRDGGNTWTTVDTWTSAKSFTSWAKTITSDAQGNLFVAGTSYAKDGEKAYVRVSTNGGDTWQPLLEKFGIGASLPGFYGLESFPINAMAFDASNTLWTIGTTQGTTGGNWVMLRWNPASGWTAPFTPYGGLRSFGKRIAADPLGNVYGLGTIPDSEGFSHLILMKISN
jgi:hypothetical protein